MNYNRSKEDDFLYKEIVRLYKEGWAEDRIAMRFAIPTYTVHNIIIKELN